MIVVRQGGVICYGNCRPSFEVKMMGRQSKFDRGSRDMIVGVPAHHHPIGTRIGQTSLGVERDIVVQSSGRDCKCNECNNGIDGLEETHVEH